MGKLARRAGPKPAKAGDAGVVALRALDDEPGLGQTVRLAEQLLPAGKMTSWQREWCTPENVGRYLGGRSGDPAAAAGILAQALAWRKDYKDVLSGAREPRWQTDFRVLARGVDGVPIIYGCFRHNVPATAANLRDIKEHMAAVLEAASRQRRRSAAAADNIVDCHGFRMMDNLNPAPMLALMKMVNQPYRDGLRTAIVVDAPRSFQMLWRAAAPLLSEKTKNKIRFLPRAEAVQHIAAASGAKAAAVIDRVMALNRGAEGCTDGCKGSRFPSEVPDSDSEAEHEASAGGALRRAISRQYSRAVGGDVQRTQRTQRSSWLFCCQRRRSGRVVAGSR